MIRWGLLLFCMILTSFGTAAVVHSREISGTIGIDCSSYVHSEGDADDLPHGFSQPQDDKDPAQGGSDQAVQHHNSCHGTTASLPAKYAEPIAHGLPAAPKALRDMTAMAHWSPGPDLRPPIA